MAILAVESPTFQPAMRIITAITQSNPAAVTTSFDHDYVSGMIVRLVIPPGYGLEEYNEQKGTITVTGDTTFTIDIDTTIGEPFTVPAVFPENKQSPQVLPIGEINSMLTTATRNVLPY